MKNTLALACCIGVINMRNVWYKSYLIPHLGTGVDVKAQVVVGQLRGLFLQLPGESDLPVARNTQTHLFKMALEKAQASGFGEQHIRRTLGLLLPTEVAQLSNTHSFSADPAWRHYTAVCSV